MPASRKRRARRAQDLPELVPHPRYGAQPQYTGLHPEKAVGVCFHWRDRNQPPIPETAIPANPARQRAAIYSPTHYFDRLRNCRDCGRPFLFHAREQQHWYEELGFGLDADCVRCVPCRKQQQRIARLRRRYESLLRESPATPHTMLDLADCTVSLVEAGIFHPRQLERVRHWLKQVRPRLGPRTAPRHGELWLRVLAAEGALVGASGESLPRSSGSPAEPDS
ncbi:MAG: zinc-ribbon domain-containing protein [Xanthomonadales bacterium]|jgi:hypothetical protein|nr:zinc-ribbon domain-containing protein [Xanthomonadales bacterium]